MSCRSNRMKFCAMSIHGKIIQAIFTRLCKPLNCGSISANSVHPSDLPPVLDSRKSSMPSHPSLQARILKHVLQTPVRPSPWPLGSARRYAAHWAALAMACARSSDCCRCRSNYCPSSLLSAPLASIILRNEGVYEELLLHISGALPKVPGSYSGERFCCPRWH